RELPGSQDQCAAVHRHRMHPDEQPVRADHGDRSRSRVENLRWSVTVEERRAHLGHNRLQGGWCSLVPLDNGRNGRLYPLSSKVRQMSLADSHSRGSDTLGLRSDAWRNRQRILRAARETFAERGLDAPLSAIARRAGFGMATVYRRFPTREALVTEVFAEQFHRCDADLEEALNAADPWRGMITLVYRICGMQVADRGFT